MVSDALGQALTAAEDAAVVIVTTTIAMCPCIVLEEDQVLFLVLAVAEDDQVEGSGSNSIFSTVIIMIAEYAAARCILLRILLSWSTRATVLASLQNLGPVVLLCSKVLQVLMIQIPSPVLNQQTLLIIVNVSVTHVIVNVINLMSMSLTSGIYKICITEAGNGYEHFSK